MNTPRSCLRDPIPEIAQAASLLAEAAVAHMVGDRVRTVELLHASNLNAVREWTESLWGAKSKYVPKIQLSKFDGPKEKLRMPSTAVQKQLLVRDGYHCRYCAIPLIRPVVRKCFQANYPEAKLWGKRNIEQHAAFQAMWMQFDHVVPHSFGGTNNMTNIVVTCAPCNFAKMEYTLEQLGLSDPRIRLVSPSEWDGLERVLAHVA